MDIHKQSNHQLRFSKNIYKNTYAPIFAQCYTPIAFINLYTQNYTSPLLLVACVNRNLYTQFLTPSYIKSYTYVYA